MGKTQVHRLLLTSKSLKTSLVLKDKGNGLLGAGPLGQGKAWEEPTLPAGVIQRMAALTCQRNDLTAKRDPAAGEVVAAERQGEGGKVGYLEWIQGAHRGVFLLGMSRRPRPRL